ncbi:hypothetical protein HK102_013614 [Quaeritorhiza haematococci]|nr:hypothetical protein HK102_013614 [Quaeritorhiza haematococci]
MNRLLASLLTFPLLLLLGYPFPISAQSTCVIDCLDQILPPRDSMSNAAEFCVAVAEAGTGVEECFGGCEDGEEAVGDVAGMCAGESNGDGEGDQAVEEDRPEQREGAHVEQPEEEQLGNENSDGGSNQEQEVASEPIQEQDAQPAAGQADTATDQHERLPGWITEAQTD